MPSVRKSLKSAVDILIINLAAADCLYCFGLPIWANDLVQLRRWELGKHILPRMLSFINHAFLK